MARGVRILHLADSHIGADLPGRPRSNRRRRGDDFVASYRRVLALAAGGEIDLVIHAGDVFDTPRPNDAALAAAAGPLLALAAAGVPVVVVPGNHERAALPESLLLSHANLYVVRRPCTLAFALSGMRVAVAAFPCNRRQARRRFAEALDETGWECTGADVNILAVHQTFESATCGPAGYRFRSGEDVVERGAVPPGIDYVAAGHIHRHQVLAADGAGRPPIVYAGSPDRISFAERDEPKGAVVIEAVGDRLVHRFVEHAVRPMAVVPLDVSGLSPAEMRGQALERIAALPREAVALLRLSGETTRCTLRGLDLARRGRAARPDVLLTVSSQAVEFVPQRQVERALIMRTCSAFACLDAPPAERAARSIAERRLLPAWCGTYALRDKHGRVLYVGKAKNVRLRVQTHVAGRSGANAFAGWTEQIASVEARRAYSELEALLVEAELIRKLRPPFNRQMRSWSRYCYLCSSDDPYGQLTIWREPGRKGACFGPYRSRAAADQVREASAAFFRLAACPAEDNGPRHRMLSTLSGSAKLCERYFAGLCTGPCAGCISSEQYRGRIQQRDALLGGVDDAAIVPLERRPECAGGSEDADAEMREVARRVRTLRSAYLHAVTLRRAEALLRGVLLLPGPDGRRTVAVFTRCGARLTVLPDDGLKADRALAECRAPAAPLQPITSGRLPKEMVDCLCTVARELQRGEEGCSFVPAASVARLAADRRAARAPCAGFDPVLERTQ